MEVLFVVNVVFLRSLLTKKKKTHTHTYKCFEIA